MPKDITDDEKISSYEKNPDEENSDEKTMVKNKLSVIKMLFSFFFFWGSNFEDVIFEEAIYIKKD